MRRTLVSLGVALTLGVCVSASAAKSSPGDDAPVPASSMPLVEQQRRVVTLVDAVTAAESDRGRLRAHANLLAEVDALYDAMRQTALDRNADAILRSTVVWALGERGTQAACDTVRSSPSDTRDPLLLLALGTAKARCGDFNDLRIALAQGPALTRSKAAVTLGVLQDTRSLQAVTEMSASPDFAEFRDALIVARGLMGDKRVGVELVRLLNDRSLHMHAAIALGRNGQDLAVFDLQAATRSPESLLRWASVQVLTAQKLPGTCAILQGMDGDADARIDGLTRGVMDGWRADAEAHWRKEGFSLDHFTERAYCP